MNDISPLQRMWKVLLWLSLLVAIGTWGYVVVEGWSLADGLFMTLITLSTVGYGEVQPLSSVGRMFTTTLIVGCLVGMTYWTAILTSFILEHDLNGDFARRRTRKMIAKLSGHVIICGAGPLALHIIDRLARRRLPIVVIDQRHDQLDALKGRFRNVFLVQGDPSNELTLAEANVLSAETVIACMESEIDNLLIGITCKDIGASIVVYARSNDPQLGNRMRKSGIDEVISPSQLVGDRIAELVTQRYESAAAVSLA